uniref:Uncharacterized protein n=1 Tax=Microviridae sp. ct4S516 TaxID=2826726 RepID=A0A8S5MVW3_9VIRU|nr:MAG TPA: hypothetical protein [Microviridae sp. ct4S516]
MEKRFCVFMDDDLLAVFKWPKHAFEFMCDRHVFFGHDVTMKWMKVDVSDEDEDNEEAPF